MQPATPPADIKSIMDRAVALHQRGKLDEAETLYRAAIAQRSDLFQAHHLLGVVFLQRNDLERALAYVDEAIRIEPRFPDAHHSRGRILDELGRRADAAKSYERALAAIDATLQRAPRHVHAHHTRGKLLEALKRPDDALASYEQALDIDPNHVAALTDCGTVLAVLGREEAAIARYDAALKVDPRFMPALFQRAKALAQAERYDEALADLDHVLVLFPGHLDAIVERAKLLRMLGHYDAAVEGFERALSIDPGYARAKLALANLYVVQNRYADAAAIYSDVLAGCRDDQGAKIANLLIGWARLPSSYIDADLLPWFDKAKPPGAADIANPDFQAHLAFAKAKLLHDRGRHDEAWRMAARANAIKFREIGDPARRYRQAWQTAKSRLDVAAPGLEAAMRDDPSLPVWLFLFGPSRGGKTTLETLAATIPGLHPGYENRLISVARQRVIDAASLKQDLTLADFGPADRARFCEIFDPMLRDYAGEAKVVTCTLPGYIEMMVELAGLVPNMRFAVVRRDPDDTAFRIYMNHYKETRFRFAYDMTGIREYLAFYEAMTERLAAALPQRTTILRYEDIVADPAAARAALAQLCGLPVPAGPLPAIGDDRGCAEPYRAAMAAALSKPPDAALSGDP